MLLRSQIKFYGKCLTDNGLPYSVEYYDKFYMGYDKTGFEYYVGLPGWISWSDNSSGRVTNDMLTWCELNGTGRYTVMTKSRSGEQVQMGRNQDVESMGVAFENEEDAIAFKLACVE